MDGKSKPTRAELFAMVWDRPATAVAEQLGVSDAYLSKLCKKLQVPKPPRWTSPGFLDI